MIYEHRLFSTFRAVFRFLSRYLLPRTQQLAENGIRDFQTVFAFTQTTHLFIQTEDSENVDKLFVGNNLFIPNR